MNVIEVAGLRKEYRRLVFITCFVVYGLDFSFAV